MSEQSESHPTLRRYLTAFYGITLGLALILAIVASILGPQGTPVAVETPQAVQAQTKTPATSSTQAGIKDTSTAQPDVPATPDENTPSPLGVAAANLRGVQVSLWHPWVGKNGVLMESILEEFNRSNSWGITVRANGYEGFGRLDDAVQAAMDSPAALETPGTSPDLPGLLPDVLVDYGYTARRWDKSMVLVDLTPYINDPVWGWTNDEQDDFVREFWEEELVSDRGAAPVRRLGIPFYRSAYMVFYNQSWGRELGYSDPPANPDEFQGQACAAGEYVARQEGKSDPGRGGWLVTDQPAGLIGWLYAFEAAITDPSGQSYRLNNPETLTALQFLKGLQEEGCAWRHTGIDPQSGFASRQALFVVGSLFEIAGQQQAFVQADSTDEWMVIPFPSDATPVVVTYGPSLYITQSSPARQLAAWLVARWLADPLNQAKWAAELQAYPARLSAFDRFGGTPGGSAQWAQALELLPEAHSEPTLVSWSMMRWALADAMAQLFNPQFSSEQIPALLQHLDRVGEEITNQVR